MSFGVRAVGKNAAADWFRVRRHVIVFKMQQSSSVLERDLDSLK